MFTEEQCLTIAKALSFQRSESVGDEEKEIEIVQVIEQTYPGLLKTHFLDHLLTPEQF